MSTKYPDLQYTQFPNAIDTFKTFLDIMASDGPLIHQYVEAMNAGNQTLASQIYAQIPYASQKIITSIDLNTLMQSILAVERFYKSDVQPFIEEKQVEWQALIDQFTYKGAWSPTVNYVKDNLVDYTVNGIRRMYLAIGPVPMGVPPTNGDYFRVMTIEGQRGAAGEGFSYSGLWDENANYTINDTVTYEENIYRALTDNLGQNPATSPESWIPIIQLATVSYPIQDNQPSTQTEGELWFNTEAVVENYHELRPLTEPAVASDIAKGKMAYDQNGNLLIGTKA